MNHPNIIKLIDKGYTKDQEPYTIFEFIEGVTLKDIITDYKKISVSVIRDLMAQVLDAISYAHSKGIIHCDLKPQNIMVVKTGFRRHIKVLDFGLGVLTRNNNIQSHRKNIIPSMDIAGTPVYSAPEQLRGEPPSVKSDLYAWGLILIECLTGKNVIQGENVAHILQQQLSEEHIVLPTSILKHPLGNLLRRVLMKNPVLRAGNTKLIYEEFLKMDLPVLSDTVQEKITNQEKDHLTIANPLGWQHIKTDKRYITILCIKLNLNLEKGNNLDLEAFDIIQKNLINLCIDTAIRYGGHVSGKIANTIVVYFGYPQLGDNDARIAGTTALKLLNKVNKRKTTLLQQERIILDIQMTINSGVLLSKKDEIPEGPTLNTAINLLYQSKPGQIIVHKSTKRLLDKFLNFKPYNNNFLCIGERQTVALLSLKPSSAEAPLLGRKKEVKIILNHWENNYTNCTGILINGQAGIGKSKLIYEIKSTFLKLKRTVYYCQCLPEHQSNTLYPIFNILKKHLNIHETSSDQDIINKLKQAIEVVHCDPAISLPILCSWFSIPLKEYKTHSIPPENQREFILELLKKVIFNIGNDNKFLLIIEDLHWIDPTSELFLEGLLKQNNKNKCLVLLSARPKFTSKWTKNLVKKIELSPLTKKFVRLLVENILDNKQVSDKVVDLITKRTDGVALYIEELTLMLYEKKIIAQIVNKYELVDEIENIEIPSTLKGLLQTRLKSVGLAIETAQLAATIGREFSYNLLVKSSLKEEQFVKADLDLFLRANIIYLQKAIPKNYAFKHALIRDAAYESMTSKPRKDAHQRIGQNIKNYPKKLREENIQRLAYHSHKAEKYKDAILFYKEAADLEMLKKLGQSESLYLTNKALSINTYIKEINSPDYKPIQEVELRLHKAAVLTNKLGWKHPEIIENYRIVETLQKVSVFNNKIKFALAKGLWVYECTEGNVPRMHIMVQKMKNTSKALQNTNYLAQTFDCLSQTRFFNGDFKGSIKACLDCYDCYDHEQAKRRPLTDGLDPFIVCKSFEALSRLFIGEVEQSITIMKSTLVEAKSYHWSNLTMGIYAQTSRLYLYMCSFSPINSHKQYLFEELQSNITLFEEKGAFPYWENAINLNIISAYTLSGNQNHIKSYQEARKKWAPKTSAKAYYDLIEAVTFLNKKAFKKALKIANTSIRFSKTHNVTYGAAYAYCFKAKALDGLDKKDEALNAFMKAMQICKEQQAKWIEAFVSKEYTNFLAKEKKDNRLSLDHIIKAKKII